MEPDRGTFGWDMPAGASPLMDGGWGPGDDENDECPEEEARWSKADDWYDEHGHDFRGC